MVECFQFANTEYERTRYVLNIIRCIEAALCAICLAVALYIALTTLTPTVAKVILVATAAGFTVITLIDIISTSYQRPIYWNSWILFATGGTLFFFLCVGLLIATETGMLPLLLVGEILNGLTAVVFLIDVIFIINALRKRYSSVTPDYREEIYKAYVEPVQQEKQKEPESGPQRTISEEYRRIKAQEDAGGDRSSVKPPTYKHTSHSVTSYGGTFPVAKDAAPLPSPEPPYRREYVKPASRNRPSAAPSRTHSREPSLLSYKSADSRSFIYKASDGVYYTRDGVPMVELPTVANERFFQAPDGKTYTKDGTPLREFQNAMGERFYRRPDGKMYLKNGTPLTEIEPPLGDKVYKGPDGRTHLKGSTRLSEICPLGTYTAQRRADGRLYGKDGKPLTEIVTASGDKYYRGPDGTYTDAGEPLIEVETPNGSRFYKRNDGQFYLKIGVPLRAVPADNGKTVYEGPDGNIYLESGTTLTIIPISERAERGADGRLYSRDGHPLTEVPGSGLLQSRDGRFYLEDGTPVVLMKSTPAGELIYQAPDGSLYNNDGKQLDPNMLACLCPDEKPIPCATRKCMQETVDQPPPCLRTVAVSTRMVPKTTTKPKCHSCPGSPQVCKEQNQRTVKSAEAVAQTSGAPCTCQRQQYQQQQQYEQPCMPYSQYISSQCKCQKAHYQPCPSQVPVSAPQERKVSIPQSQVPPQNRGSASSRQRPSSSPSRNPSTHSTQRASIRSNSPSPSRTSTSPHPKCNPQKLCAQHGGDYKCPKCLELARENEKKQDERHTQTSMLQPITECEGEERASNWSQHRTGNDPTSQGQAVDTASNDYRQKESMRTSPSSTDNDEVQTNETRMITAEELQSLPIPGSTDNNYKRY